MLWVKEHYCFTLLPKVRMPERSKHKIEKMVHEYLQCDKSFTKSGTLKTHQMTHTGLKPDKCSDCGKAFTQIIKLKTHQMSHTGLKPRKCADCGKAYMTNGDLKRHQMTHTGLNHTNVLTVARHS